MDTMEENGELVFLYQLIDGVTNNSHALYTAKLVGIPQDILDRVAQVLLDHSIRSVYKPLAQSFQLSGCHCQWHD